MKVPMKKFICALICAVVFSMSAVYAVDIGALEKNRTEVLQQVVDKIKSLEIDRERLIGQVLMLQQLKTLEEKERAEAAQMNMPLDMPLTEETTEETDVGANSRTEGN